MVEEFFTKIYKNNVWGNKESVSGPSSTIVGTVDTRRELPKLFDSFGFKSVLDLPCGDLNWMKLVLEECDTLNYMGCDIVEELITSHKETYKNNNNIEFMHLNMLEDILPNADVIVCRDCLFHFSYSDTKKFLNNFLKSKTPYLLTTTHFNINSRFENKDINTGGWRWMDLFSAPYNFTSEPIYRFKDGPDREMCMWSQEQIESALK